MQFGEKITEIREMLGMTRAELSKKTGFHINTLYKCEHDLMTPTIYTAYDICTALGVNINDVLDPSMSPTNIITKAALKA